MSAREIDDAYKRIGGKDSYRAQRFDGKKSMIDDYTGKRIFLDSTKHPNETAAQVDHIISLEEVQKRYPDLSLEQQKMIANDTSNYAMTNGKLNMHIKNRKMNHQVVSDLAPETIKEVASQVGKGDVKGAVTTTSEYVKTSTNMINKEASAAAKMTVNATKCRAENFTDEMKSVAGTVASGTESEFASVICDTARKGAGGAVVMSTIVETVKAIQNNDDMETFAGNVVGKGAQAAVSAGGGAAVGELAGVAAAALGAGPIGVAVVAIGSAIGASGAISEATDEIAEGISGAVSEGIETLRLNSSVIDGTCSVIESIGTDISYLWNSTIGMWFW